MMSGSETTATSAHRTDGLRPFASRTTVPSAIRMDMVATLSTKPIAGRITKGMAALARTAVRSETGSDFQNRMLRSRRSP